MLEYKFDTQLLIEGENLSEDDIHDYITAHFKGDCLLAVGAVSYTHLQHRPDARGGIGQLATEQGFHHDDAEPLCRGLFQPAQALSLIHI